MIEYGSGYTPIHRRSRPKPAYVMWQWWLGTILWSIAAIVLVVALTYGFLVVSGSIVLIYIAAIGIILTLTTTGQVMREVRWRRSEMVLAYVEQAVRLNLPLPAMIQAAESSERPAIRRQLKHLRELLQMGAPLSNGLELASPQLPARKLALVGVAERTGRLAPMLQRLVQQPSVPDATSRFSAAVSWYRVYPILVLVMVGSITAMLMVFVIPKFEQIMLDFGMPVPPATRALMSISRSWALPLVLVLQIALILIIGRAMANIFRPFPYRVELGTKMIDRLLWHLPIAHGLQRDRGLADVCQVLADCSDAGMSLDAALAEATQLRINHVLRRRIESWARSIRDGQPIDEAARRARMPALMVGMLASGKATVDAQTLFQFLARYYRTRFSRAQALIAGALVPAVVLALAILVGFIALALFQPIVNLAEQVRIATTLW